MLSQIRPLNQEERQLARAAAVEAIVRDIGERPQRDHFNQHAAHHRAVHCSAPGRLHRYADGHLVLK